MIGKVILGKEYDMVRFQMTGKSIEGTVLDKINAPMRYNFKKSISAQIQMLNGPQAPEIAFEFISTDFYIIKPIDGEDNTVKYIPCQFIERIIK